MMVAVVLERVLWPLALMGAASRVCEIVMSDHGLSTWPWRCSAFAPPPRVHHG